MAVMPGAQRAQRLYHILANMQLLLARLREHQAHQAVVQVLVRQLEHTQYRTATLQRAIAETEQFVATHAADCDARVDVPGPTGSAAPLLPPLVVTAQATAAPAAVEIAPDQFDARLTALQSQLTAL